jgi:formate hydrogenlyase subunit 3/multisubunit Na+/H+ antiporter MnhD subunit
MATLAVPLAMTSACLFPRFRQHVLRFLPLAPLPALPAAVLGPTDLVVVFPQPFRMTLMLDPPGAILLGGAALLWTAAGAYASSYMRKTRAPARFAVAWLLCLTGSIGLFIVADLASFYLLFTMASLAAYGLIVHEESERAFHASSIYVALALAGEAFLLLAFVMLATASPDPNPLIHEVVRALPASPHRDAILGLLLLGCALKLGLVPLHIWLPLAHPAAPMPASAVLSGVLVKAGAIGLIRFLPFEASLSGWGNALIAIGLITAFWGAAVGLTQYQPKVVLAYSTVSQMGLVAAIAGAGLSTGDAEAPSLVAYYGLHHMLAKGSLFLAVGILAATGSAKSKSIFLLTAVLAISLGGLPLTSGALAKLASKPMFGYGLVSWLITLTAVGSTVLMLHFLAIVRGEPATDPDATAPRDQLIPWLIVASASLTVPWMLYPGLSGNAIRSALQPASLWKSAWPVGVGVLLALALRGQRRNLPTIPQGDIIRLIEPLSRAVNRGGTSIERADRMLQLWPIAGTLLAGIMILLVAAFLSGG